MKIRKIKRIVIEFMSLVLLSGLAWAADTRVAMPLTQEGGTARAMSMGSAVVGVPMGSASLLWNPAGLGLMDNCMELGLHQNSGLGDSNQEKAVFGIPLGILGGFGASFDYVNNGSFEGRDSFGNPTGNYTAGDLGGSLGWGKKWFPGFAAGVAVKYNQQTLANRSYTAYAADLGVLWNPPKFSRLTMGLNYSNLGDEVAGSALTSGWRAGASYEATKDLLLALSGNLERDG